MYKLAKKKIKPDKPKKKTITTLSIDMIRWAYELVVFQTSK